MAQLATTLTPYLAEILALERLSYASLWKHLKVGPEKGKPLAWSTNTLEFRYDPATDCFTIWVSFADPAESECESTLRTADLVRELEKHTRGAP